MKPGQSQQYDWKSSCETWGVAFSADGTWFAWSQGHGVVRLLPWPLQGTEHNSKALECKNQGGKTKPKGYDGLKEKTLECGQIVWGLAFSSWLPSPPYKYRHRKESSPCLILATGLNDGQIKVWEVETGNLLFNLVGHQDVVRDLSFAPGHRSSILVSASRDKTLRIWDLGQNGKRELRKSLVSQTTFLFETIESAFWTFAVGLQLLHFSRRSNALLRGWREIGEFKPTRKGWCCVTVRNELGTIDLWHHPLQPVVDQSGNFHTSSLRSVCFSPEGLYLATVADDRLLRIWALELESPVAFAPVKNGLCCTYFPHGGIIATGTRDGHAQFWTAPQALSSLKHLCRKVLRRCFTSYQVQALSIPKKMKEFLTYRTL
ncbi:hypothetical protein Chor_013082 [Crotalus horridus]